ncbi:MAG: stage V sporulation protein AB [Defluviitaleaceae bacterium]|nr:stage V sporulation protein AB [Defluviitaleaceae bacterium]
MPELLAHILSIIIGLASGMIISGAVFAFVTAVGVVPHLARKTRTHDHVRLYESAISIGGIFGTIGGFVKLRIPFGMVFAPFIGLFAGIFYGCLAMALAEVIGVFPILTRRGHLKKGVFVFVLAIAVGKLCGSLMYFLIKGFYVPS